MKKAFFVLACCVLLFGCGRVNKSTGLAVLCAPPYIEAGSRCCLDADNDSVCDSAVSADFSIDGLAHSLVRINWQTNGSRSEGNGFFISKDKVLTSWELIKGYDANDCFVNSDGQDGAVMKVCSPYFRVMDYDGDVFDNHTIVSYSGKYGIAIIQLDSADVAIAGAGSPVSFGGALSEGDSVYAPVFSPALALKHNVSVVEAKIDSDNGVVYRLDRLFSGYIGLPVVSRNLDVVGMFAGNLDDSKSFVLGAGELKRFAEYALMVACSPNCSLSYERMSEAVRIYKPAYVDAGRYHESNSPQDNKVYFKSFTISVNNDDAFEHSVCFGLKVIKNGILEYSAVLYPELAVKARMESSREIKANWQDDSSGGELPQDYYFEVSGYDCASKAVYNKFYFRGKY